MNRPYTAEDDSFIIENCKKMNYAEIASRLGRPSEDSIHQRVEILERQGKMERFGLVKDGVFHSFYSAEEDSIIKRLYPSLGKKILAKRLGRPESSLRYRAAKLGVKPGPPNYLNPPRIAKLLGVCQRIVIDWIYQGFLKANNRRGRKVGRHREWKIKKSDFHEFVREYYYLYDPGRVKDEFLRSIIAETPAAKAVTTSQAAKILGLTPKAMAKRALNGSFSLVYKGFGPSGHTRWYVWLDGYVEHKAGDLVMNHNFRDASVYRKIGQVVSVNQKEIKVDFQEGIGFSRIIRVYKKGLNLHCITPHKRLPQKP